jgi:HTH-type transcriptional regulator, cell division transcriptional repressor
VKKTRRSKHKNVVGARVKAARERSNPPVSQDDLCGRLARRGVKLEQPAISKLENGERYVMDYEVLAIAEALRVSVGWLYDTDSD